MSKFAIATAAILFLLCGLRPCAATAATTAHADAKSSAIKVADAWLKIIDGGKYDDSWKQASTFFRDHVSEEQWTQQVGPARRSLGAVISRKVMSVKYITTMPGAPNGQYVVIHYQSSFEHRKPATETVTPMLDNDGQWRVSGYYIK